MFKLWVRLAPEIQLGVETSEAEKDPLELSLCATVATEKILVYVN